MQRIVSLTRLQELLGTPAAAEAFSVIDSADAAGLVVDLDSAEPAGGGDLVQPACPVIGLRRTSATPVPAVVDVLAGSDAELEVLERAVRANPLAASVLVQVLRHNATASVGDGLLTESLAYSTLQHGSEFVRWLAEWLGSRGECSVEPRPEEDPVVLERHGSCLNVLLNRPGKRNAFSAAVRDALCDALELPLADPGITEIILRGAGPAFCAGGDLDEFGAARDAAIAHLTRTTRSAGALIHRLRDRITCRVHGACIGAGIELPAFAGRLVAAEDAHFRLPEVAMGLIPGAGGTVSIVRRIGRLRAAWLALSNQPLDAATALDWGLIDAVGP